jgi:hypothetical protein
MICPKNIQISKELKIKDIKEKISRSVSYYLSNTKELNSIANIKLYLMNFGMKERKKEIFEMIYSYKNKDKHYNILAEEIINDELLIEVRSFIILFRILNMDQEIY